MTPTECSTSEINESSSLCTNRSLISLIVSRWRWIAALVVAGGFAVACREAKRFLQDFSNRDFTLEGIVFRLGLRFLGIDGSIFEELRESVPVTKETYSTDIDSNRRQRLKARETRDIWAINKAIKYSVPFRILYDYDFALELYQAARGNAEEQRTLSRALATMILAHYCSAVVLMSVMSTHSHLMLRYCMDKNMELLDAVTAFEELVSYLSTPSVSPHSTDISTMQQTFFLTCSISIAADQAVQVSLETVDHLESVLTSGALRHILQNIVRRTIAAVWRDEASENEGEKNSAAYQYIMEAEGHPPCIAAALEGREGEEHAVRVAGELLEVSQAEWVAKLRSNPAVRSVPEFTLMQIVSRFTTCTEALLTAPIGGVHPLFEC